MRRGWMVTVGLALAGCGSTEPTVNPRVALVGTWRLLSIDGAALPRDSITDGGLLLGRYDGASAIRSCRLNYVGWREYSSQLIEWSTDERGELVVVYYLGGAPGRSDSATVFGDYFVLRRGTDRTAYTYQRTTDGAGPPPCV